MAKTNQKQQSTLIQSTQILESSSLSSHHGWRMKQSGGKNGKTTLVPMLQSVFVKPSIPTSLKWWIFGLWQHWRTKSCWLEMCCTRNGFPLQIELASRKMSAFIWAMAGWIHSRKGTISKVWSVMEKLGQPILMSFKRSNNESRISSSQRAMLWKMSLTWMRLDFFMCKLSSYIFCEGEIMS